MAEPVRCDVCGGLFSSRHLSSHKRLSHGSKGAGQVPKSHVNDQDAMRKIIDLFSGLSEENKKNVLDRLAATR
jgi:DNA-directed RNA polymerase subunit N (RpoN/RPB10)